MPVSHKPPRIQPDASTAQTEVYSAAVNGLQTALNAVGGTPVDLTTAPVASVQHLITAMATKAAATAKASKTLTGISSGFAAMSPSSVAAAIAATPLADSVTSVAAAPPASLMAKDGAETVAAAATQMATVIQQIAPTLTDGTDAGSVSTTALTTLMQTLLPTTGVATTQAQADTAVANAIASINGAMPGGKPQITVPPVPVQPPMMIPKKNGK